MSLVSELSSDFPRNVRARGDEYFTRGLVKIKKGTPWAVEATVRGGQRYNVLLLREDDAITGRCSCPYFETDGACKHLWATILEADDQGRLRGDGRGGPLTFVDAYDEDDEDDEVYDDDNTVEDEQDEYDEDDDDEDDEDTDELPQLLTSAAQPATTKTVKSWKDQLAALGLKSRPLPLQQGAEWPLERELLYIVDVPATVASQKLVLDVLMRDRRKDGQWGQPRKQRIPRWQIAELPNPVDREIFASLAGAREQYEHSYYYQDSYDTAPYRYSLIPPLPQILLPIIARTGRCGLRTATNADDWFKVEWDDGAPWQFWVEIKARGERYEVKGELRRGEERMELSTPVFLLEGGIVFTRERAAQLDDGRAFSWLAGLRRGGPLDVAREQIGDVLTDLLGDPGRIHLDLPDELRYEETTLPPRPALTIKSPPQRGWSAAQRLRGKLSFDYAVGQTGGMIAGDDARRGIYVADRRQFIVRDHAAEASAKGFLTELGFRFVGPTYQEKSSAWELAPSKLPRVVRELVAAGWHVEAEGKVFRNPGEMKMQVSSGIDWFELHGEVNFGYATARLPELLAALRRGESMVKLDDGTFGLLPEEWLKKYGLIANLGEVHDDHLRFKPTQIGVLDALLAAQPDASFDAAFARAREELKNFGGIEAAEPPESFVGQLRPYQKDGLGWMHFLRRFGFGGCLADDMGTGKTVQVLALLAARRELRAATPEEADAGTLGRSDTANGDGGVERREKSKTKKPKNSEAVNGEVVHHSAAAPTRRVGPSLVVVPKSLVFNWKQEAARFAPQLRVLEHLGQGRQKAGEHFDAHDLIITTYGTLRRDAVDFKDVAFDYVILDEAQAIKNADTGAAKAARLLHGDYRLALSGTPVENHLGELWSLFEFLNPGMLGAASVFKLAGTAARNPDEATRKILAGALRPFILRRTKDQVAKDLPAKNEQTLFCELEPKQRKLYNELRDHYRNTLLDRIAREGIAKAKIQVLEALLRLRQAACHPGLIDKKRISEASAKLDMLLPQLSAVLEEGHKALVFSQFTSLLSIVRGHLDKEGVVYEYLDGKTRDRQARVERFQNDPDCKLFLISLKAGGLGLNLTAAEYVYLLDPWWNPAVEAQAIDRAHRIGQTQQVFAYRLIARDTVEEKVLQLQSTKRDLAEAIINADNSLIRNLAREDLELLLS
jgi:superfamily II DNA or RNA helicase